MGSAAGDQNNRRQIKGRVRKIKICLVVYDFTTNFSHVKGEREDIGSLSMENFGELENE